MCQPAGGVTQDTINAMVDRITNLQMQIEKITDRNMQDIKKPLGYLNYLMAGWVPHLQAAKVLLPAPKNGKVSRTLKCGSAGILRFEDVGGWTVLDRDALQEYLETLSDEELVKYGAKRRVHFESDKIVELITNDPNLCYQPLAEKVRLLPGIHWYDFIPNGKVRVGTTKPWSIKNITDAFGRLMRSTAFYNEKDE